MSDLGESLSEKSRVNRLLKGARLEKREQGDLLERAGGFHFQAISDRMRLYSEFQGAPRRIAAPDGHRPLAASTEWRPHE